MGLDCKHHIIQVILFQTAAIDGNYTEWSPWEPCSRTCDVGTTSRMRNCTNPAPSFGGKNCSRLGDDTEVKPCQVVPCPGKKLSILFGVIVFNITPQC